MREQRVLVTAGARGIGRAIVRTLLDAGWSVAFTYRTSEQAARALEAEGRALGRTCVGVEANLQDAQSTRAALGRVEACFGMPQAVVHNYGPFSFVRRPFAEYSDGDWARLWVGNVEAFRWLVQWALPAMRTEGYGRIVALGSDGAEQAAGWRYRAPYAAAKAALASLVRSIAAEEAPYGITANMVCPGDLRNTQKERLTPQAGEDSGAGFPSLTPTLVGGDVARVVAQLLQPNSGSVSGSIVSVTGGVPVRELDAARPL
ncbi:MAG: SDR family oxidoreductase [Alicyclobacillus sp.]|nr:SDR family oxidoreductase [Alicyclobacillus sp.]